MDDTRVTKFPDPPQQAYPIMLSDFNLWAPCFDGIGRFIRQYPAGFLTRQDILTYAGQSHGHFDDILWLWCRVWTVQSKELRLNARPWFHYVYDKTKDFIGEGWRDPADTWTTAQFALPRGLREFFRPAELWYAFDVHAVDGPSNWWDRAPMRDTFNTLAACCIEHGLIDIHRIIRSPHRSLL